MTITTWKGTDADRKWATVTADELRKKFRLPAGARVRVGDVEVTDETPLRAEWRTSGRKK